MQAANAVRLSPLPPPTLAWLDERRRAGIAAHLCRLDPRERVRRFGRAIDDDAIVAFANGLDFRAHWLAGAYAFDQRLIGVAHACPVRAGRDYTVYAAISVDVDYRGRGIGRALLGAIADRLHDTAAASVVAIGSCFDLPDDDFAGEHAYELCAGVRIEAEPLPAGRAYRDTLACLRGDRDRQSTMNSSFSSPTSTMSPLPSSVGSSSIGWPFTSGERRPSTRVTK
jgi:GNAT superfamily N-acetyltransferase